MKYKYIAHIRHSDGVKQSVETHLTETAAIAKMFATKLNLGLAGELVGLMHDFGKFAEDFFKYISDAKGRLNPDIDDTEEDDIPINPLKGKIDHSTAGAQWVYQRLSRFGTKNGIGEAFGQMLALCIASHHGTGLIDCINPNGEATWLKRLMKDDQLTHLNECKENADKSVLERAETLAGEELLRQMMAVILPLLKNSELTPKLKEFYLGCFTRFLFSCLIDADRISSADFEKEYQKDLRQLNIKPDWEYAITQLEQKLSSFTLRYPIDSIRKQISDKCLERANDPQGIYTLTVPTGGGKTLSSLRHALYHAKKHNLDRIIYIISYTSIIEQNAQEIRDILGDDWVLEHHSNLDPEKQTWQNKLWSENWDKPIVFTTMVQFLDAWFGGGTRGVRHVHAMVNSILIFDEIQTLSVKCVHLFCNVLNWLTQYGKSSAILCTATQPLLEQSRLEKFPAEKRSEIMLKGLLKSAPNSEIMGDVHKVSKLFDDLSRVDVHFQYKQGGWSVEEAGEFLLEQFAHTSSCLFVVNTKKWAVELYKYCQKQNIEKEALFHLSTHQCATHRKDLFERMKQRLAQKLPVICISTQLIEAGVNISMGCVIRALAGLDSIAQAAGRCNRHGENSGKGNVWVLNLQNEPLAMLPDIQIGQQKAERVFSKFDEQDILQPQAMEKYFDYYFYHRSDEMSYSLKNQGGNNLLDWLSDNARNPFSPKNIQRAGKLPLLMQSFKSAGRVFQAIDAPTKALIVPYGKGKELITALCENHGKKEFYKYLSQAQRFSVNLFPNMWEALDKKQAIHQIADTGYYYLSERYYLDEYGVSVDEIKAYDFLEI